jgi:pimeloyl-ACP methyl ester carboxylesterase
MLRCVLATLLALTMALWTLPAPPAQAPVAHAADLASGISGVYVHVPRDLDPSQPAQVLVTLHGVGGNGEQFASQFLREADRNHWIVVSPTIAYGDWMDPAQVAREDPRLIRWLGEYLAALPTTVKVPVRDRVLLLGHSRGAQLAHRFAFFQPERVLAVAALAAGTYTLPVTRTSQGAMVRFPFGLGDLSTITGEPFSRTRLVEDTQFWVGVGAEDDNPGDLPRAWDQYLGTNRVQRARAFYDSLHDLGVRSVLVAFRGAQHSLTPDMAASACSFLRTLDLNSNALGGTPARAANQTGRARF